LHGTIRPLAKPFSRFILHRAGRLKQLNHSRNPSRTISKKKQKKWVAFQMTYFLISTSFCKGRMSIYYFQSFQDSKKKKAKVLFVSTFLYKFIMQSQEKIKFFNIFLS